MFESSEFPEMDSDATKTSSFAAWSFKSLFEFKGERGKNITVQCKLCKPREKFLSTSKSSTSNLKKHLVRKHSSVCQRQAVEAAPPPAGQSCLPLERSQDTLAVSPCQSTDERPAKQPKASGCHMNKAWQRRVNALVFGFIIDCVQPFSILEQPSFLRLLEGLQPSRGLLCPKALVGKVWWASHCMKEALEARLLAVQAVCTSADVWSAGGRSYLAVTCHWMEEGSGGAGPERKCAALMCAALPAPPTCETVATKLSAVHAQFGLRDKVQCTVTDSGSTFVRVFAEFDSSLSVGLGEGAAVGQGLVTEARGVVFQDVGQLLECDSKELQLMLPALQRCSAQVLSRLARQEVRTALGSGPTGALYKGAMVKCAAIWGLAHSPSLAPPFLAELGAMATWVPQAGLWRAEYYAIRQVLLLSDAQAHEVSERLGGAEPLGSQEVLLLQEYADVLQPLAYSLDFIQGERKRCMLGYLLPTLLTLKAKLAEARPLVRFCGRLIDGLLGAIDVQFATVMASRDAKMAAVTVPKLRLWWAGQPEREEMQALLLEEATQCWRNEAQAPVEEDSDSEAEDKFFGFAAVAQAQPRSTAESEVLSYLQDADKTLASLSKYPTIRRLFLRYNTTLAAGGASVQRLFSHNAHMVTPELTGISEEHLEQVLLLRYNQELCPLTNEAWHWS